MTDGTGTTNYSYEPVGSLGALKLAQEESALPNSAIAYTHDALGRAVSRNVAGAGAETFGYDSIGRLTSHTSDLGSFTLSYLGQTGQIATRAPARTGLSAPQSLAASQRRSGSAGGPLRGRFPFRFFRGGNRAAERPRPRPYASSPSGGAG